jgi:DNA-binding NarL/FixJ family response regulator
VSGETPIAVAVLAYDQVTRDAVVPSLERGFDLRLVGAEAAEAADVLLVLVNRATDALFAELAAISARAESSAQCVVLVSDPLSERHVGKAIECGVVSMLSRRQATAALIRRAIVAGHGGRAQLPDSVVRWLVDEARMFRQQMLASNPMHPGGLSEREVNVLRLLADGQDTAYIAEQLNYSPRTIKKIIQDLLTRLGLHNRSHAVSYAIRVGAI